MATPPLINYTLSSATVKNADGSYAATTSGLKVVAGPGATAYGTFANVVEFAAGSKISVPVQASALSNKQFAATVVFKMKASVLGRQTLADCSALPFTIWCEAGGVAPAAVGVQVKSSENGAAVASSQFKTTDLNPTGWNQIDLIYDTDTLVLVLNKKVVTVIGLPNGKLATGTGSALVLGQSVVANLQFQGQMALFQFHNGIPDSLKSLLSELRSRPEWLISRKYMSVKDLYTFGNPLSGVEFDSAIPAYQQRYQHGVIIAPIGAGEAFEVHGLIYVKYRDEAGLKAKLGAPLSNEINGGAVNSRKNMFTKGGIYYSDATGAQVVLGVMYSDYEAMGGGTHVIGLPTKAEASIPGGKSQDFQRGTLYKWDGAPVGVEVHGVIRDEFVRKGGIGRYGFPLSNELPLRSASNVEIGRVNSFQLGSIYYSAATGARELRGDILRKYLEIGSVRSQLGLPTTHEETFAGLPGSKYNSFQRGTILNHSGKTHVAGPFMIYIERVETKESDELDQNDLFLTATLKENNVEVWRKRWPETGHDDGHNIVEPKLTSPIITPNDINKTYTLSVKVTDYDDTFNGGDDQLGTYTKVLDAKNAWGWAETEDGSINSGVVSLIKNIKWHLKRVVPPGTPKDFWNFANQSTPTLTYDQACKAMRDMDNTPDVWDPFDYIDRAFYDAALKKIGAKGNCYGVSTLALKAWEDEAGLTIPLKDYTLSPGLLEEIQIHQARQLGDCTAGWAIDQFTSNMTQNPKEVFTKSQTAATHGNHPVICFTDSANLMKNSGHCVLPIKWDATTPIWKITVFDPNHMNVQKEILIDSVKNTWSYNNGKAWAGGHKTGGRLYYIPGNVAMARPRTPYWAVLGRIPDLVSYFFSDLLDTVDILDEAGKSLNIGDITDMSVADILKKFVPFIGMGQNGNPGGTTLLRPAGSKLSTQAMAALAATTTPNWSSLNLGDGFTHRMTGKSTGTINLGMTHHLSSLSFNGGIEANETLSFGAKNFNTPDRLITLKSGKARSYGVTMGTRFGLEGDAMNISFNFPTNAGVDAKLMIDPSMSRVDLLTSGTSLPTTILINGRIGGTVYQKKFDTTIEGGVRLNFQDAMRNNIIQRGKIDALKGTVTQGSVIQGR